MPKKQSVFFPNLDGLRFICFLMVFLFHCYKTLFANVPGAENTVGFLFRHGELGVNFFFVLSGFLITFLLIREREFTGTIHIGNFYVRRILRIWPLFYLCVFIGFVVWPYLKIFIGDTVDETSNPWYYLLLINNFDYIHQQSISAQLFPDALILIVLWSVAVEEQFYLSWPILLRVIKLAYYPLLFVLIIGGTLAFRAIYAFEPAADLEARAVLKFHTLAVIGDMAVGALMAFNCSREGWLYRWVKKMPRYQMAMLYGAVLAILLFHHKLFPEGFMMVPERLIIALVFGLVILEQNYAEKSFYKFSSFTRISKLGTYTYGLYCYHFLVISLMNKFFSKIGWDDSNFANATIYSLLSLSVVMAISILSYRYFEKPFLKLKDRFAFIVK